jgi:ketosteroid isomerase-like protein
MSTAERYRAGVEAKDLDSVTELLAEEIVFHSAVTFHPFLGRETVTRLLAEVVQVMLRPLSAFMLFAQAMGERAQAADRSKIVQQTTRA